MYPPRVMTLDTVIDTDTELELEMMQHMKPKGCASGEPVCQGVCQGVLI